MFKSNIFEKKERAIVEQLTKYLYCIEKPGVMNFIYFMECI